MDYLARFFIDSGWSIKKLHREILLSSAYATSVRPSEKAIAIDPENRLLSHFNRQRLDAETLRDSMLAVSGNLKLAMGGPAVKWDKDFQRRTVYGEVSRFRPERYLSLFDFPDPSFHAEKRVATNTSVQRLFFLNSEFIKRQSADLAALVKAKEPDNAASQVRVLYSLLFGPRPGGSGVESQSRLSGGLGRVGSSNT